MIFNGQSFVIIPNTQEDAGMYPIDIELTDRFSPPKFYTFLVTVLKTPPKPASQRQVQRASIKVTRITRDALLEF